MASDTQPEGTISKWVDHDPRSISLQVHWPIDHLCTNACVIIAGRRRISTHCDFSQVAAAEDGVGD